MDNSNGVAVQGLIQQTGDDVMFWALIGLLMTFTLGMLLMLLQVRKHKLRRQTRDIATQHQQASSSLVGTTAGIGFGTVIDELTYDPSDKRRVAESVSETTRSSKVPTHRKKEGEKESDTRQNTGQNIGQNVGQTTADAYQHEH